MDLKLIGQAFDMTMDFIIRKIVVFFLLLTAGTALALAKLLRLFDSISEGR